MELQHYTTPATLFKHFGDVMVSIQTVKRLIAEMTLINDQLEDCQTLATLTEVFPTMMVLNTQWEQVSEQLIGPQRNCERTLFLEAMSKPLTYSLLNQVLQAKSIDVLSQRFFDLAKSIVQEGL